MHLFKRAAVGSCAMLLALGGEALAGDRLETAFRDPPPSARPRVWWHWMNGNVTKEGIQLDLEWMHRVGLGGFQTFDASLVTPQVVENRLSYMTPAWKDAFRYSAELADRFGLEMSIAGSPGWSESGGPWVAPQAAMKKLVWTETAVRGGQRFRGRLLQPSDVAGPFGNAPYPAPLPGSAPFTPPRFYRDALVVAYRSAGPETAIGARVTSSAGPVDAAALADGDLGRTVDLPHGKGGDPAWIQFDYGQARTVRSLSAMVVDPSVLSFMPSVGVAGTLQASDDGRAWRKVVDLPWGGAVRHTLSFEPVTARYFRLVLPTPAPAAVPPIFAAMIPKGEVPHRIAELSLSSRPRVNRVEEKAGFGILPSLDGLGTPAGGPAVDRREVVDLTGRMSPDGALDWTPPPGDWVVLRLGYSLTGQHNGPASAEATGLEVDKLSRRHVADYMDAYLAQYRDAAGPGLMGARGLRGLVNDSWEAGAQNWTEDMVAQFTRRRGYDPRPYLPVLTGVVVGDPATSERFLWDFRTTIEDLVADEHYGEIARIARRNGLVHYGESHENGRAIIADGMQVKRDLDVPMGAMWAVGTSQEMSDADIRESASVAHIYGQNLVAAESMTALGVPGLAYAFTPARLKPVADRELSDGLNRFVIHTSVHQALVGKAPGISLGPIGQWFTRNETWAEQATPWVSYLSRSSALLQQGRFVADVAWFYGEDSNVTALYGDKPAPAPAGYNYDFVNPDALEHALKVEGGRLSTPGGASYRVLMLDPRTRSMSLPILRRLRDLVWAGAVIAGDRPTSSPSLADDPAAFQRLADELWGAGDSTTPRRVGQGMVYPGTDWTGVMRQVAAADFTHTGGADTPLRFVHRQTPDGDIYFVHSLSDRPRTLEASFRIAGKAPELWRADTGTIAPASYRIEGGRTVVPLDLEPHDAVFVVFRKPATAASREVAKAPLRVVATAAGPWTVSFQPGRGAPGQITLERLASLSTQAEPGVKYFSGAAAYRQALQAPASWFAPGQRVVLDLGEVHELAEVLVNGRSLGVLWKAPFQVDVTTALRPGANTLEIRATNLWVNRMIGDKQPGARPVSFTTFEAYGKDSPLPPSGLLGPVRVMIGAHPAGETSLGPVPNSAPAPSGR